MKLANSTQSILAQVTARPHRPWCNTEYIFVANVPHNTFYENIRGLKFQEQNVNRPDVTSQHPVSCH